MWTIVKQTVKWDREGIGGGGSWGPPKQVRDSQRWNLLKSFRSRWLLCNHLHTLKESTNGLWVQTTHFIIRTVWAFQNHRLVCSVIGDWIWDARHDSSDRMYLRDRGECQFILSNGGSSNMNIQPNMMGLLCCVNHGLGDRDVIGPSGCFTLSLKGVMPCESVTTFEATLVVSKEGALSIGKIQWVRVFCWWGWCRAVGGEGVHMVGRVCKVILSAALCFYCWFVWLDPSKAAAPQPYHRAWFYQSSPWCIV